MKNQKATKMKRAFIFLILCLCMLSVFSNVTAEVDDSPVIPVITGENGEEIRSITVEYSGTEEFNRLLTVDYSDEWLLRPDNVYNHDLMQASFVLAAAGFRDKTKDLSQRDYNILDFFSQAGFSEPQTYDFDVIPSINTIGTAIAYKNAGDATLIAVSISGNNYQGEWAGNLTIDDENRVKGFNDAADKVMSRVTSYISSHELDGDLRLWTAGYSRSAAVTNDFAADATDSGLFDAVYAYTFATPRTTKDSDGEKYGNIFNLINPFDMVPMVPFPEWGFHRYGIDLYFPAIETDSGWYAMQKEVSNIYMSVYDDEVILNPQINKNLHTLFDYLAFFISSANSYKKTYQDPLVNFIEAHSFPTLVREITRNINFESIYERIAHSDEIARYQMHEFYGMIDFITQFIYTSLIGQFNENAANIYWDPGLSVQENLAFNHYDKTYWTWLFSDNDPETLLTRDAKYAHVVISGDVEVDVLDENGNFVVHINNKFDSYSFSTEDVRMPGFDKDYSDTAIYFERQKGQTLLVLPTDQTFRVGIYSRKDQMIRVSYVEFSVDKLQADVRYVYLDEYDEGEYYLEEFDPEKEKNYTTEELMDMGVLVVEPWSQNIVYSPTAIMRLENGGVSHPSPKILLVCILLIPVLLLLMFIRILLQIIKLGRKHKKKRTANTVQVLPETEASAAADNGTEKKI